MCSPLPSNGLSPEKLYVRDTIAAIATGRGAAGVGIVRVSGDNASQIAAELLNKTLSPNLATYTNFYNQAQEIIDSGVAIYFKAPNSFTGEDILELQGHGGFAVLNRVLQRVTATNLARIAEPGEFTKRAYLNNKMDLLQAEAVLDLIHAGSEQAAAAAIKSLSGDFSQIIHSLQQELIALRVFVEAALDFPEEEIDFLSSHKVLARVDELRNNMQKILLRVNQGVLLAEGVDTVILGAPNVGKSSLLNCLTKEDTSIVTEIPGTTRDLIKTQINLNGIMLKLVDTAGIRESDDLIEQEGISRAKSMAEIAELIIYVVDTPLSLTCVSKINQHRQDDNIIIVVINKIDQLALSPAIEVNEFLNLSMVYISAKHKLGIDLLEQVIIGSLTKLSQESVFSARTRHVAALKRSLEHLELAKYQLSEMQAMELLAEELTRAQHSLNQLTGEFSADDLLGKIFSEFCIGK